MAAYCDKPVIIPHVPRYSSYEGTFRYFAILSALMPKYKASLLVFHKYAYSSNKKRTCLLKLAVDAYLVAISAFYTFPLFRIMPAMHLSACLIHFTRRSIHRSMATISALFGPKFMIKKSINYKAGVRSLLTASKRIRLSADITIEKGIDYQPFRSNFPATRLGAARWDSVARKTSCVTTIYKYAQVLS